MSKSKMRRSRHATKPSIQRTHIALATWPGSKPSSLDLGHEVELVKAALLYADTVELLSPANQALRSMESHYGAEAGKLATIDPDVFGPEGSEKVGAFKEAMDDVHKVTKTMREDSGLAELDLAVARRLLYFNDRLPLGAPNDELVRAAVTEVTRYLSDVRKLVVLDSQMADLALSLIKEGKLLPPARVMANAEEAAVGTGLIARLPAFPSAPMDELLDLRDDLQDPLTRYRRAASGLRAELLSGPFGGDMAGEVDAIWRTRVAPEFVAMKQAMAEHGFVREVLKFIGSNPKEFMNTAISAGLTVYFGGVGDLTAALASGTYAVATAAPPAARQAIERESRMQGVKQNDLFYLYELDRRA